MKITGNRTMKVKVKFFTSLVKLFGGAEREVELTGGASIRDLLETLCDSEKRRREIFDDSDRPIGSVQIFKNHRPIQSLQGVDTGLEEGDVVSMLPPVFGG